MKAMSLVSASSASALWPLLFSVALTRLCGVALVVAAAAAAAVLALGCGVVAAAAAAVTALRKSLLSRESARTRVTMRAGLAVLIAAEAGALALVAAPPPLAAASSSSQRSAKARSNERRDTGARNTRAKTVCE